MPPKAKFAATACFATTVLTVVYWVLFFFVPGTVQSSSDTCYLIFERSFPAADAWMIFCTLLAGLALLRQRRNSLLWGLLGGGSMIYLGCMDVLCDLENGVYAHFTADVATEIVINLLVLTFGPWLVIWFWRQRAVLLALPA